jgi:hypothetical protein
MRTLGERIKREVGLAIEFRRGGRKVSSKGFFDGILEDAVSAALDNLAGEIHAKAASIVDPETGKHAPVFVRKVGQQLRVEAAGSEAFAKELERRLGLEAGEVGRPAVLSDTKRLVYLAHATEDKMLARPIAEGLIARGIDVWYDQWEIGLGDSVRRKMDDGLGGCTHFVALLTHTSLKKPWVNEELDAGLLAAVEGSARFVALRHEIELTELPPLLRNRLAPELVLTDKGLDALAAQVYGVTDKPALGPAPRYVQTQPRGFSPWSQAALTLAEYFVKNSRTGYKMDPQATYEQLQEATGLPAADVRLGALDLLDAGMIEKSGSMSSNRIWPLSDLFSTFDGMFLETDPAEDAKALATYLANTSKDLVASEEAGKALEWTPRRFNPAAHWLISARIVKAYDAHGGTAYRPYRLNCGDQLLRFIRSL